MAEQMRKWSPYAYGFNNPIRFIDPDGRQPDDPNNPFGNDMSLVENIYWDLRDNAVSGLVKIGSYFNSLFNKDAKVQRVEWSYNESGRSGQLVEQEGNKHVALITGTLDVIAAMPGGNVTGGLLAKAPGTNSTIVDIVESITKSKTTTPSLERQADNIVQTLNEGRNSVTIGTVDRQIRYDLQGKDHAGVPTPHKQVYNKNIVDGEVRNISRASKHAQLITQQEIRAIRKWLEKQ